MGRQQVDTTSSVRRRRRVIPIIDARFQWKYTLLIVALGVGVTSIMGGLLYKAHLDNTRLLEIDQSLQEQVIRGDQIFLLYLVVCVIGMAVALGVWGLIVTHRISGPLSLVVHYLDVLADGQYPDLRPLRKSDELQHFFATFEDAVVAMRSREEARLRDVETTLVELQQDSSQDAQGKLKAAVKALTRYQESLAHSVGETTGQSDEEA